MRLLPGLSVVLSFVAARGLQFMAPVITANLMARSDYGAVEFAHAVATIAVAILSLGMPGVIPFVVVKNDPRYSLQAVRLHQCALCIAFSIALPVLWVTNVRSAEVLMTGIFAAALAVQLLCATTLRSRGATASSLFVEAAPFTLVALGAFVAHAVGSSHTMASVALLLAIGTGVLLIRSLQSFRNAADEPLRYAATLRAGIPLMLGGLLTLLATTSGRLGIGLLGDNKITGDFAAIARIAALPMVAQQLLIVAAFRDLYSLPLDTLERLLIKIVVAVAGSVATLLICLPLVQPILGAAFIESSRQHPQAVVLLFAQAVVWSGAALNDLVATRHEVMRRVLPGTGSALIIGAGVAAWQLASGTLSVETFAAWHTAVLSLLFAAQVGAMALLGVRYWRFWLTCAALFVATMLTALAFLHRG